jgi:succinyl-diaminopimelate desuccinylase
VEILNVDKYRDELILAVQELLQIPSVKAPAAGEGKPFGVPIAQALEYILAKGEELGLKTENFSGFAGHIEFGEGPETLGILCHLDVVPAGEGWSVEPFAGLIKDGKIFGRGAIDNKGPAAAVLYAMAALKDSGWQPRRKVRLILGTDEESGWACMEHYLPAAGTPDLGFTPDAKFPVINSEKGILRIELSGRFLNPAGLELVDISGGNRPNMVPDRCIVKIKGLESETQAAKIGARLGARMDIDSADGITTLVFKGVSAHGSMPETGENAISYALAMLNHLGYTQGFIGFLAERIGFSHDGRGLNIELRDSVSGSLTVNVGVISTEGETVKVQLDIRYPVSFHGEQVIERIQAALTVGISLHSFGGQRPLHVDADNELVRILQRVYEKNVDAEAELLSIGGGTYARALNNAVAFGPIFPGQPDLAHQPDENIPISQLVKITEIYADAIAMLGNKGESK